MTVLFKRFIPALLYLIVCTILLCLPKQSLPDTGIGWFNVYHIDKLIHAILFAILVYLFCSPIRLKGFLNNVITKIYFVIFLVGVFYGFIMELVQKYFIAGRSFEGLDIVADAVGAFIGYSVAKKQLQKQVPPSTEELLSEAKKYAKDFVQDKTNMDIGKIMDAGNN